MLKRPPGLGFSLCHSLFFCSVVLRGGNSFVCFGFRLGLFGVSFVRWLCMVGCVYPRGAVGSRPKPWTRLCCSESHWSNPVALPVGQPRAPASSTRLPTWFVSWWTECGDSAACLFCGRVALRIWIYYNRLLCILQCTAGLSGTMTS